MKVDDVMTVAEATKILRAAEAWPRCGEGWPRGEAENAAAMALLGRNELGRTPEEEAAVDAYYTAKEARGVAIEAAIQAEIDERLKAATVSSGGNLLKFLITFGGPATLEQVMAGTGLSERHINSEKLAGRIKTDRKGRYLL